MQDFIQHIQDSLKDNTFIKLTLSKNRGQDRSIQNVYIRKVTLKNKEVLSFTLRYATRDEVKNHEFQEALAIITLWLGNDFLTGHLFTSEADITVNYSKKRVPRLFKRKASLSLPKTTIHNKKKNHLIEESAPFLQTLGISSSNGKVHHSKQAKYRQINKYIEILDGLLMMSNVPDEPHIVDMGAGKGYLTFALYDYLQQQNRRAKITGIELRQNLVDFCNTSAKDLNFNNLEFLAKDIDDFKPTRIDILIALHACDIATDIAIAKGIKAKSELIICAPCCHKQVRQNINQHKSTSTILSPILQHGILEERQAELVTDTIRALLLEAHGYKTKVFEFIDSEHTGKNLMIVGIKQDKIVDKIAILKKVDDLKALFGVETHYLEQLITD